MRRTTDIRLHEHSLKAQGLDRIDRVAAFRGDMVQDEDQQVVRLKIASQTMFLKRMGPTLKFRHVAASLLRHGRVNSRARREWSNYLALNAADIATARPVAFGEECSLFGDRFSFIITEAAPGQSLDALLENSRALDPIRRRRLCVALGQWVRRMHDKGFAFPDLLARHIFVETRSDGFTFSLIDVARLHRRKRLSDKLRSRDLAALNVSIRLAKLGVRERLRFLRAYGETDRGFIERIVRRTRTLAKRRIQFRDFETHAPRTVPTSSRDTHLSVATA